MKHWWLVIVLAIILTVSVGIGYAAGYRIGPNITLVKTRTLTITDLPAGASVFADYAPRGESAGGPFSMAIVPGAHTILVSAPNYSPWASIVQVPEGADATVQALVVPKAVSGTLLSGTPADEARALIKDAVLPTEEHPLVLAHGCALVSLAQDGKTLIAAPTTPPACAPPPYLCVNGSCAKTVVYSAAASPSAIVAYPGRQDALLMQIGQNIFALSLDPRDPRTFVSVLHGIAPHMAARPDGTVVVSDQSSVYTLDL